MMIMIKWVLVDLQISDMITDFKFQAVTLEAPQKKRFRKTKLILSTRKEKRIHIFDSFGQ